MLLLRNHIHNHRSSSSRRSMSSSSNSNTNTTNTNPLVLQRKGSSNETDIYLFHPDATVENILALRYLTITKPKRFYIFLDGLSVHHVRALMEILQHFARQQILWKTFELRVANVGSFELVKNLIQLAHSLEMGEQMVLHQGQIPPAMDDYYRQRPFLLSSVMENKRMKHLCMDITLPRYSLVDIGLLGDLLRTTQLEGVSLRLADGDNLQFLCDALADNTSLTQLQIDFNGVNTDGLMAAMLASVQNHPTLQILDIEAEEYGDLAFESIGTFLETSVTLQELEFRCSALDAPIKVVPLLRGLSAAPQLTKFVIEGFQTTTSLSALFQAAARKPTMKHVGLLLQDIMEPELTELQHMTRLPHAVLLDLPNSTVRDCASILQQMLQEQPEIRFSDEHVRASAVSLRSICNLNYHGRYLLLQQNENVSAISIWPQVLQKANRHPNVLYTLLHGPAFCSRGMS